MSRKTRTPAADLLLHVPVADAIAALFRPHVEVVIHDLDSMTVAHVANGFSGRKVGDSSVDERFPDETLVQPVIGPYRGTRHDGRNLRSVTAVLRHGDGRPHGMMCINFDVTLLERMQDGLAALAFLPAAMEPQVLFHDTWRQTLEQVIQRYEAEHGLPVRSLDRAGRTQLVARIHAARILDVRNAAPVVAARLGVSRASLYKDLKDLRG